MRDELLGALRAARDQGQTVLFSSHVLAEVERVCDRVGILQRGRLVHQQTIAELQRASLVRVRFSKVPSVWPALAGLDADGTPTAESVVTHRGEPGPLLEWLGRQDVAALRVEPLGLAGIYSQYHGGEE